MRCFAADALRSGTLGSRLRRHLTTIIVEVAVLQICGSGVHVFTSLRSRLASRRGLCAEVNEPHSQCAFRCTADCPADKDKSAKVDVVYLPHPANALHLLILPSLINFVIASLHARSL